MTAEEIIAIAEKEVGTVESPYGSNRTKYGEAYGWNGVPWCVIFVWWCFYKAKASKLFYGGGKCASCSQYIDWCKKHGNWITGNFAPGDILFIDVRGDGVPRHAGICRGTAGNLVLTVEGNTSDIYGQDNGGMVLQKERNVKTIVGAARPDYGEDENMTGEQIYEKLSEYLRDLPAPAWAKAELNEAVDMGITDGSRPMQFTPRYQAAIMAKRAAEKRKES